MDNKYNKLFLRYLKENKVYKRYQINFEHGCELDKEHMISMPNGLHLHVFEIVDEDYNLSLNSIESLHDAINYSFVWANTKEGHDYWKELHMKMGSLINYFVLYGHKNRI